MGNIDVQKVRARVEALTSEIKQIYEQYKIEVPKKRRPWQKSIQERVLELWRSVMSSHANCVRDGFTCAGDVFLASAREEIRAEFS